MSEIRTPPPHNLGIPHRPVAGNTTTTTILYIFTAIDIHYVRISILNNLCVICVLPCNVFTTVVIYFVRIYILCTLQPFYLE